MDAHEVPQATQVNDAVRVVVQAGDRLTFYAGDLRPLGTVQLETTPLSLRCFDSDVLVWGDGALGVMRPAVSEDIRWVELPKLTGCGNSTLDIVDWLPSLSAGVCISVADGAPDTSTCEQTYHFNPTTTQFVEGCQVAGADLPRSTEDESGLSVTSPRGQYRVQFGDVAWGDYEYYRSLEVFDHPAVSRRSGQSLVLAALSVKTQDATVDWLPGEVGVVAAARLIALPELEVVAQGEHACALSDPP